MTQYFAASPAAKDQMAEDQRPYQATVQRSAAFRANASQLTFSGFQQRLRAFSGPNGALLSTPPKRDAQEALNNPDLMTGMLKQQMGGLVPQMAMGAFVNYFFGGFILGRIPFSLSPRFRVMLQRGIDLPALEPSYFTSLSFYLLALFGLGGAFRLVFAEEAIDDAAQMAAAQQAAMPSFAFDPPKAYQQELGAYTLLEHKPRKNAIKKATELLERLP